MRRAHSRLAETMPMNDKLRPALGSLSAALLLAGCAALPPYQAPAAPLVADYTAGTAVSATATADVPHGQAQQVVDDLLRGGARRPTFGRTNPLLFHVGVSSRLPLGKRRDHAVRMGRAKWGTAVTPFTPLRTAAKDGYEESVSYVAKNQRPGRMSLLFTNRG